MMSEANGGKERAMRQRSLVRIPILFPLNNLEAAYYARVC